MFPRRLFIPVRGGFNLTAPSGRRERGKRTSTHVCPAPLAHRRDAVAMVTAESAVSPPPPPRHFSSSMSKGHRSEGGEVKRGRVGRREKTEGSRKKRGENTRRDDKDEMTKTRRRRERKGTSNREDEEDDAAAPELSSDSQCTVITPVTSLAPPPPPPGPLARAELQSHSSASIHSTAIRQKAPPRSRAAALILRLATCCFIDHETNVVMLHFN